MKQCESRFCELELWYIPRGRATWFLPRCEADMTFAEMFAELRQMSEAQGKAAPSDQKLDSLIEMVSKLPCTGQGVSSPVFRPPGQHVAIDVGMLDSGEALPPEIGCMHCTWLAALNYVKSVIEAQRNSKPLPPMP